MGILTAASFNKETGFGLSVRALSLNSGDCPDGAGIAYARDGVFQVIKEPLPLNPRGSMVYGLAVESPHVRSRTFLANTRRTSRGPIAQRNTQPFSRIANGKDYCFVCDTDIPADCLPDPGSIRPLGETADEKIFCVLIDLIEEAGISDWDEADNEWLYGELRGLNGLGLLNCVLSDGEHLFCYCDKSASERSGGLAFLRREPPYGDIRLTGDPAREDYLQPHDAGESPARGRGSRVIDLSAPPCPAYREPINLAGIKGAHESGYIVSTKALTNEHWECFYPGELIVYIDGKEAWRREPTTAGVSREEPIAACVVREGVRELNDLCAGGRGGYVVVSGALKEEITGDRFSHVYVRRPCDGHEHYLKFGYVKMEVYSIDDKELLPYRQRNPAYAGASGTGSTRCSQGRSGYVRTLRREER